MYIYRWKCEVDDPLLEEDKRISQGTVIGTDYCDAMNRVFAYMANEDEDKIIDIYLECYKTDIISMSVELINKVDDEVIW